MKNTLLRSGLTILLIVALTALAAPATATDYTIDTNHSSAIFKIKHYGVSYFYGAFKTVTGTVQYDSDNPAASSIDLTIDAESVDSRVPNRDDHIKSPDFLNAKQFPAITFKSKSATASGDTIDITGTLTLHGVSKDITVTATKIGEGEHPRSKKAMVGFHSEFTVKRSDFDMNFMIGPLGDEVTFILSLETAAQ